MIQENRVCTARHPAVIMNDQVFDSSAPFSVHEHASFGALALASCRFLQGHSMSTLPIKLALESLEAQIGAKDVKSYRHASPSELCICLPLHSLTPKRINETWTNWQPQLQNIQSNPTDVDTACNKSLPAFLLELPRYTSRWALSIVVSR